MSIDAVFMDRQAFLVIMPNGVYSAVLAITNKRWNDQKNDAEGKRLSTRRRPRAPCWKGTVVAVHKLTIHGKIKTTTYPDATSCASLVLLPYTTCERWRST